MSESTSKIVDSNNFRKIREQLRQDNRKVVMCHGVYDLLHIGHIEHLKDAKRQGDILIVSVTSARFVNKGPDRPYYNDKQRMEFLANLEIVDFVILSEEATAKTNIELIRPDVFVKGQEFESGDDGVTGNVHEEIELVQKLGGKVYFSQGEVHSSSKILNNYFNALPEEVIEVSRTIIRNHGENAFDKIANFVESFKKRKVLVIGDVIFDEYIFCKPQGLTSKDTALSTRYERKETYLGGALAVARHISNYCDEVNMLSVMGNETELQDMIRSNMEGKIALNILTEDNFITPVKRKYLKEHIERDEFDKLFSMNKLLLESEWGNVNRTPFYEKLEAFLPEYDLVVLCDYGHGLIDGTAKEIIESKANFLAVNCQTNSSNYGTNIITKYNRADTFALDEKELKLAFGQVYDSKTKQLTALVDRLSAKIGWLTVGAKGAIAADKEGNTLQIPALTLHVKDTVGAGDAFFAISSLCAAEKCSDGNCDVIKQCIRSNQDTYGR